MVEITGETMLNFTQQMAESGLAPNEGTLCVLVDETAYTKPKPGGATVPDGNYCAFYPRWYRALPCITICPAPSSMPIQR